MKKFIIFSLLILYSYINSYSQAKIGFNMSDIRKEFPNKKWEYGKWGDEKLNRMSFTDDDVTVIYYLDDNNLSISTAIFPLSQGLLQGMIERYNKRYVIVDDTHWKFYINGGVLKCDLMSTDDGGFYFYWY